MDGPASARVAQHGLRKGCGVTRALIARLLCASVSALLLGFLGRFLTREVAVMLAETGADAAVPIRMGAAQ